jgi:hypothetical protein
VEYNARNRLRVDPQRLTQMPADRLSLPIFIGRDPDLFGFFDE